MTDQESEELEEVEFRLRYGNVFSGLCRMVDEYCAAHQKYPEQVTLVPILWRELVSLVNWEQRYMPSPGSPKASSAQSIMFLGFPVIRGTKCQALPDLPTAV